MFIDYRCFCTFNRDSKQHPTRRRSGPLASLLHPLQRLFAFMHPNPECKRKLLTPLSCHRRVPRNICVRVHSLHFIEGNSMKHCYALITACREGYASIACTSLRSFKHTLLHTGHSERFFHCASCKHKSLPFQDFSARHVMFDHVRLNLYCHVRLLAFQTNPF